MRPKVEAWSQGVRNIAKIFQRYPQSAYAGLGMSLQLEWQYLQITVPGFGSLMGPIYDALREAFFPALLEGRVQPMADYVSSSDLLHYFR